MFKISIIIPLVNQKDLNNATFKSLLNQTIGFENLQIIFITPNSKYVSNLSKYENIININVNNKDTFNGQLYNIGIKHASSDYLMFLNPYDAIMDNLCETLYKETLKDNDDIISGVLNVLTDRKYLKNDYGQLFSNLNISDKLFKKSFITENQIRFPEDAYDSYLAFLTNAIFKTSKIKIINKKLIKPEKSNQKFSKEQIKGILNNFYEMYYSSQKHEKTDVFNRYLIFDNLNYFIDIISTSNLPINDLLELFEYSKPLFKLYYQNNDLKYVEKSPLFEYIFQEKYENAISYIYGENIPKQKDIKIAAFCDDYTYESYKFECNLIRLNSNNWLDQIKNNKPDLFLYTTANNEEIDINEILNCFKKNNVPTVIWENKQKEFDENTLNFDYIFSSYKKNIPFYESKGHENVNYLMFATQPRTFNPLTSHKNLITDNSKNHELVSNAMTKIQNKFDLYRFPNLKASPRYITYNREDNLKNMQTITEELVECPSLENNELCIHEIFELMSSNRLIFTEYSKTLFDLFNNNIYYFNRDNIDFTEKDFNKIKNQNMHNVLKNHTYENRFRQILDTVNFKYIPHLKHVFLFYELNELTELDVIYNHFHSIKYPYKEMMIITSEDKLYLPNTILKSHLNDLEFNENEYFVFADYNLDSDFICDALLHSSYLEKNVGIKEDIVNKFAFNETNDKTNIIFNGSQYKRVISEDENEYTIYCFNNYQLKVSVIIPIYNVEKYLEECLDSVINQTLKDIEIICINDGSYDSSLDILKEYSKKDSRIKIITQYNKGPGGARNTGLDIAQGKYIYFIDSDDIIEINGLKEMYQQAEFKDLDMLKFNLMTFEDETGKEKALYQRVKPAFLQELGDKIFDYKTIGSDVYTLSPNMQSSFFRRDAVKDIRFPEKLIFEDNIYLIEALFNSKRVYYYNKFLSSKRERADSITQSTGDQFPDILEIRNQIVDLAKKYDFYDDYKFTIYSRKYMFIKLLFLQTAEYYKKKFFEKIKEDCLNKKEEYEKDGIFDILDKKSLTIFNAALNSEDYKEFEKLIKNA
ncbi:MAG: glycosyltransferase [Methanobrevibacter sp.]|uniref:glycosyltransferase n=1 Tax=Methanobrevibacter sp. TaxID=66852 RepID=UPI0025FEC1AE|nr:glycosyltransferase [Methanobrevibacter sp.]MBE6497287.1 glycosyltransferase [Methanobrevibacter sp.]